MDDNQRKVWNLGLFLVGILLILFGYALNLNLKRAHEAEMKKLENEQLLQHEHPGVWRKG